MNLLLVLIKKNNNCKNDETAHAIIRMVNRMEKALNIILMELNCMMVNFSNYYFYNKNN